MVYGGDWMRTYDQHVADILAAGKPVLVYAGTEDFMCNHMVRFGCI
jgi:carboxypeptidase C (cathepsin A)